MPASKFLQTLRASCGCRKLKPTQVHEPTPVLPKSKITLPLGDSNNSSSSSSSSSNSDRVGKSEESCGSAAAAAATDSDDTNPNKITNSIAVVKDSNDPYQDFKHSMLQMIFENEIYTKEHLQELLNCLLQLNSSSHHALIIQAFTDVCNEIISK